MEYQWREGGGGGGGRFFFNDTATTEIYTLSLHDALLISEHGSRPASWTNKGPSARREDGIRGLDLIRFTERVEVGAE